MRVVVVVALLLALVSAAWAQRDITRIPVRIDVEPGLSLAGELTEPSDLRPDDRRPAIVLIHGSGAFDMDETMPSNVTLDGQPAPIFRQLADSLARAGFIVLRYNKRGVTAPTDRRGGHVDLRVWETATPAALMHDAMCAVDFLRRRPEVRDVSLLGHSEGTMIAVRVAHQLPIRSLIMLSVVSHSVRDVLHYQRIERMERNWPALDPTHRGYVTRAGIPSVLRADVAFDRWDTNHDNRLTHLEYSRGLEADFAAFLNRVAYGDSRAYTDGLPNAWWRDWFAAGDNLPQYTALANIPILICQGEDDQQAPYADEAVRLFDALTGLHRNVTLLHYPGLGHAFSPRLNGMPTLGPIQPKVLSDVTSWAVRTLNP